MDRAVISDTSCLIALAKIDKLYLLRELYQEILITREVSLEFDDLLPEWILIKEAANKQKQSELEEQLDRGEASSIALALDLKNSTFRFPDLTGKQLNT